MIVSLNGEKVSDDNIFIGESTVVGPTRGECLRELRGYSFVDDLGFSVRPEDGETIYTMIGGYLQPAQSL